MKEFLEGISLLPLALTFGAYQIGLFCRKKWNHPIVNPLLIAVILIIAFLLITGVSNEVYQEGTKGISWLLTPVTVCLAVPLYEQVKQLKKNLPAILAGVAAGAVAENGVYGHVAAPQYVVIGRAQALHVLRGRLRRVPAGGRNGSIAVGRGRRVGTLRGRIGAAGHGVRRARVCSRIRACGRTGVCPRVGRRARVRAALIRTADRVGRGRGVPFAGHVGNARYALYARCVSAVYAARGQIGVYPVRALRNGR